jgi:hypothetical protein
MRNRIWLLVGIAVGLMILVLFPFLRPYWPEPGISPYNYHQIRLGMSAHNVELLIGLPPGIHRTRQPVGGPESAGTWGHTVAEEGIPEKELPGVMHGVTHSGKRVEIRQWWGTYHAIRIAVDEDGNVVGKYLIQIPW